MDRITVIMPENEIKDFDTIADDYVIWGRDVRQPSPCCRFQSPTSAP